MNSVYFAADEANKTSGELLNRAKSFYTVLEANSYLLKLQRMWQFYHGIMNSGYGNDQHAISFGGEQGELVQLPVNHFRNLAQHIYVSITSNRPSMEARAINTDYKSLAQTYLANGILDYYMREKRLEDVLKKAVEMAVVLGSGFVKMEWNATAGEEYDFDPETGQYNYEGEIEFTNLSPFDVVVDGTKETYKNDWVLTRTYKNRYALAAKYPELKDKILGLQSKVQGSSYRLTIFSNDRTDDVPVYEFFHRKDEALPNGRYMLFCDSDCVLLDMPLPYRQIPVFRIVPSELMGTPYGYTPMMDVFPLQESINSLYSTIMTNQNAFGVQNVFVKRGDDIAISTLAGGMNIIEANEPPQPINLTQTPAEIFKFLEMMVQAAETISGVGSIARGAPEASLKSGTALALVQSMSLQFMSGLQQSYVQLIEDVGTSLMNILKDFATTPKVVALVGKNNRPLLKEFTGEDINSISRVIVSMGNPLSKTTAGRIQMATEMLQMGLIKNPSEYFQVLNTGSIESLYDGEMNELLNIKSENEQLLDGKNPLVAPTDRHSMHIQEHKSVISDPELRNNPELVKTVMDHIEGHINALRNTDPALLELCGEHPLPPLQPPQPPPGAMPPQGGPGGGPPPMQGGGPQGMPPQQQMQGGHPQQGMQPHPNHGSAGRPHKAGPTVHALRGSKMSDLLTVPTGIPGKLPKPPQPFAHLPVLAEDLAPPK